MNKNISNILGILEIYKFRKAKSYIDMINVFSLRYDIFAPSGWIPENFRSDETKLEIDNFDKYSIHLVCNPIFVPWNIVGSVRLITSELQSPFDSITIKVVNDKADYKLTLAFESPYYEELPVFQSFDMSDCYMALQKLNLSYAELSRLVVDKKYRNKHIASKMVKAILKIGRQKRLDLIFLACDVKQAYFYEKLGFTTIDVLPRTYARIGVKSIALFQPISINGEEFVKCQQKK